MNVNVIVHYPTQSITLRTFRLHHHLSTRPTIPTSTRNICPHERRQSHSCYRSYSYDQKNVYPTRCKDVQRPRELDPPSNERYSLFRRETSRPSSIKPDRKRYTR